MKIVALLSWFDESPEWLARCVMSLAQIPVDHLIALDGAYGLYPGGRGGSGRAQTLAIKGAATAAGIHASIYSPTKVWATELAKRNYLFRMAENVTEPEDWYFVVDSDEYVQEGSDVRSALESSPFDVGAVELIEPGHPGGTIHYPTFPMFFRAIRGLHVDTAHFRYRTPDGRLLWGDAVRDHLEPRQMTGAKVMHEGKLRHPDRLAKATAYYEARDAAGLEDLPSERWVTQDDRVETSEAIVFGRCS